MVRSACSIQWCGLPGSLEQCADRILRPAGWPWQSGVRDQRAELPHPGRRALGHCARDERLDGVGRGGLEQLVADELALPGQQQPEEPDLRPEHHVDSESVRTAGQPDLLFAAVQRQPAYPLRMALQRLQWVRAGRRPAPDSHGHRDRLCPGVRPAGIHDLRCIGRRGEGRMDRADLRPEYNERELEPVDEPKPVHSGGDAAATACPRDQVQLQVGGK